MTTHSDRASATRWWTPKRTAAVAAVLVLAAAAAAWKQWGGSRTKAPDHIFATVQRLDFEDLVSATGALQPRDYVDVGAQVSGQLRKLHVEVGSVVTEGQLLAEIDAEQSAARVEASRASLRAQQAQIAQSQVNLQKAERDLQRLRNLLKDEATTLELVQNAETTVASTRAQIETQKAQMQQTQASMRVEESNLKYTRIYAPMAGTVVSITAKQGQTLNANQAAPTILRIADQSTMTVQTQVSEADVSKLRLGMPVYFTTLGGQGRRWSGRLRKIEPTPTVTNNVVLYNALFDVDNTSGNLMTQMTAQVFFVAASVRDALVVPMSAVTLQRRPQGQPLGEATAPRATTSAASPASAAEAKSPPSSEEGPRRRRPDADAPTAGAGPEGDPADRRAARRAEGPSQPGDAAGERPRWRRAAQDAAAAGGSPAGASGAPRRASVKVQAEDGSIAEREITIGVSNRVQAQVLSGLQEGERVVAGTKPSDSQRRNTAQSPQQSGPGFGQGLGQGPGQGPGAPAGGARR